MPEGTKSVVLTQPPAVRQGAFQAYFIYDVADTIDLSRLQKIAGKGVERAQLQLRAAASPPYLKFSAPPLSASLPALKIEGHMADARARIYDYGIVAIRLSFPFSGPWHEFAALTQGLREKTELTSAAERLLGEVLQEIAAAVSKPHRPLMEEYFLLEVEEFEGAVDASFLLTECGAGLAGIILGESRPLSSLERQDALRIHFSYLDDDLAIIHWDAAFIFERGEGAEAIESILEFANSQLAELRTYDARLDAELNQIYALDRPLSGPRRRVARHEADERAERLRSLVVDIRELSDRASNALKITGDAFYARLYRGVAARLGLADWQSQIDKKLDSVGDLYRFLTDQAQHARSEFLEIVVIVLIAVEVVIGLLGLHR